MLESKRERALAVTRSGKRRLGGADLDEKGNLFTRLALPPLDSDQPNLPSHRFHTPTFLPDWRHFNAYRTKSFWGANLGYLDAGSLRQRGMP